VRERSSFVAMGCEVVVAGATDEELARIRSLFEERDSVFSRFRPESELSRVNAGAGRPRAVSPLFARMVETALWAARVTDGLVDPTLGRALEAAGYDRDFSVLAPDPRPVGEPVSARLGGVRLVGPVLVLAEGVRLDLNGVVKAAAVDDSVALLRGPGFVSAGGDLAANGEVDVGVPAGTVRLVSGGLATSGRTRRRWLRGGEEQHHLLDPATGRPAWGMWEQVTVCGASCLAADVSAKAAYLLGADGPGWLDERGLAGRFVGGGGAVHENACWRAELEREAAACT
jgi:thiamine biosynthesis lipoprotein